MFRRFSVIEVQLGRSVQLVNPQTFVDRVWYLCEVLQEMFGCFIGANTYLTPAGSAGFAPHWDEIDAFLLQLEGKKYWKVCAPDSINEKLPRESSGNHIE
ncbi:Bifunctional lysine-specific demethylase and histidyl-hydroxylase NO66 [Parelaphostrongylus tenuis]|uniref:Bifunctional lysine-specific demethylase and histidyl-hydroxylase n=1 Tax=Parelaphostrongylus tenuis TaxID=148309 RepID=A0AAD5R2J8_PARTN|nr:Bifunctional lysine-specific demethylase and histidyl-hydroxylase NO66 [Parelaphostrongylus tenuis]